MGSESGVDTISASAMVLVVEVVRETTGGLVEDGLGP
jgi:hypothetical protein